MTLEGYKGIVEAAKSTGFTDKVTLSCEQMLKMISLLEKAKDIFEVTKNKKPPTDWLFEKWLQEFEKEFRE